MTRTDSFDYDRGIMYQIWVHEWTYESYMQYINEPKHFINPVRDLKMFDTAILEPFSKCPWYVPLIFWSLYIYSWIPLLGKNIWLEYGLILVGIQVFFFVEYVLHRFLFHGENGWLKKYPNKQILYFLHWNLHGLHHAFPQDKHRLVLPPILGYFYFAVLFRTPFFYLLPEYVLPAWMIGFSIGYLMYDLTHYYIHHANPPEGSYFKMMKLYHAQHHYKHGEEGFGISNKIWDKLFDTEIKSEKRE